MGVPKFFRWISERYPKINQRFGCIPNQSTFEEHFGEDAMLDPPPDGPDPLSTCGLPPPIDRLYIDVNGILHGCSHNNSSADQHGSPEGNITHDEIFRNVCYYLDRIVSDIAQPTELVYMAIDGVAPRAKLNQQRARRYRSGKESEIERTVYEAHLNARQQQNENINVKRPDHEKVSSNDSLKEVEPGRFTGKFETHEENAEQGGPDGADDDKEKFDSVAITPGTPFFTECTQHLEHFIKRKLSTDPKWQHLTIILSGPNVPGEGEHKIMQFMRQQRCLQDYNPNTRHCIMGQDGDLIMLGLATHEPNLVLLREQVVFDPRRQDLLATHDAQEQYIHNPNFEFLHMQVLRDYLAYEFETSNVTESTWDLERTIDDFVFVTFFVGNDFLPSIPALDIFDEAFDMLFQNYKRLRKKWLQEGSSPYLTHAGNIESGRRLEQFVSELGSHEGAYYDNKKENANEIADKWRQSDIKFNRKPSIPTEDVRASKEAADRAEYREMMESVSTPQNQEDFAPVLSKQENTFVPEPSDEEQDGIMNRLGKLLQYAADDAKGSGVLASGHEDDLKGRYYYGKFQFTPYDAEKHIALRKAYIKGLVWNLKYYYEGCVSWDWYYPYHYGPMLSDLVNIDEMLDEVSFNELGEPLKPFEQLMGCLPPSASHLLPEPYRWLMTQESSPIKEFYPRTFTVDMNGKRWPWEAVVLLPFINTERLQEAARTHVPQNLLDDEELSRNATGKTLVLKHDPTHAEHLVSVGDGLNFGAFDSCTAKSKFIEETKWDQKPNGIAVFRPELVKGVKPQSGFPSLHEAPIQSLWRKYIYLNVFGLRSRYMTAILKMAGDRPISPPVQVLGPEFVGTTVFIGYPYLTEGFVTAVSDKNMTVRGREPARSWTKAEKQRWIETKNVVQRRYTRGEGLTGTGGLKFRNSDITFSVRPLKGLQSGKYKEYAGFELEIPIDAALITPRVRDARLANVPSLLEEDPYFLNAGAEKKEQTVTASTSEANDLIAPTPQEAEDDALPPPIRLADIAPQINMALVTNVNKSSSSFSQPLQATNGRSVVNTRRRTSSTQKETQNSIPKAGGPRRSRRQRKSLRRSYTTSSSTLRALSCRSSAKSKIFVASAAAAVAYFSKRTNAHFAASRATSKSSLRLKIRGGDIQEHDLLGMNFNEGASAPPTLEFAHGTTTLSFTFKDGIVAAVDSRASIGNFVGSKTTLKVLPINDHMLGTMAGGAADCSFWIRRLKAEANLYNLTEGHRMSVARASRILSNALYENRGLELSVGTMIMGFDQDAGPSIYYVDNTGTRIGGDMFAVGSGSTFALGILDTERRFEMTEKEAVALGIKAIRHATFRDAYSGGFIGVYVITKDGWKKVYSEDLALVAKHMQEEIPD